MLVMAFLQWWYGPGWRNAGHRLLERLRRTYFSFSIPSLLRTLFAPWRRIISAPGSSLQQKLRAAVDNAVSRAVGLIMRLIVLVAGLAVLAFTMVTGGLIVLLWPILPLLGPVLIVGGLL
jgi:hypothetical protein